MSRFSLNWHIEGLLRGFGLVLVFMARMSVKVRM
jgi:hypothetical protein